jgi:hypothetical protein
MRSSILKKLANSKKYKPLFAEWKKGDPGLLKYIEWMDEYFQSEEGKKLLREAVEKILKKVEHDQSI